MDHTPSFRRPVEPFGRLPFFLESEQVWALFFASPFAVEVADDLAFGVTKLFADGGLNWICSCGVLFALLPSSILPETVVAVGMDVVGLRRFCFLAVFALLP